MNDLLHTIKSRKWLVFWLTILGAFLAFDLMVIQTPMYTATSRILVVQKQTAGQDIYSISKSAQYLTQVLSEAVYSDNFFNKVISSPVDVKASDFPEDPEKRRTKWEKTVNIKTTRDLGLMEIKVRFPRQSKAETISQAVTSVLVQNHQLYHGAGSSVELRILDTSVVNNNPDITNLWAGTASGAVIGFLIALAIAYRRDYEVARELRKSRDALAVQMSAQANLFEPEDENQNLPF